MANNIDINAKASEILSNILHDNNTKTVDLSDNYCIHVVYEDSNITVMLVKKTNNAMEKTRTVNRYEAEHIKAVVVEYLQISDKSKKKFFGLF